MATKDEDFFRIDTSRCSVRGKKYGNDISDDALDVSFPKSEERAIDGDSGIDALLKVIGL